MSAKEWLIAWRNLGRNRRRNMTTLVAVLFAYSGIVLFWGYVVLAERFLRAYSVYVNHVGEVVLYKEGGLAHHLAKPRQFTFSASETRQISDLLSGDARVVRVSRYLRGMAMMSNGCGAFAVEVLGVERETERWVRTLPFVSKWSPDFAVLVHGRPLWEAPKGVAPLLVTPEIASRSGKTRVLSEVRPEAGASLPECTPEARAALANDANVQLAAFTQSGSFSAIDADIVGWRKASLSWNQDTETVLPLEDTQRLFDTDRVSHVALFLRDDVGALGFAKELRARFAGLGLKADVYSFHDESVNGFYAGNMNVLYTMSLFFLVLVSAAAVLSTMNSVVMTILERMREMGFLRSLGFTPARIARLHTIEGFFVILGGILGGALLCYGISALIRLADVRLAPPGLPGSVRFELAMEPPILLGTALFVGSVALVTTALTAWRYARRNIIDLLTSTHT